LALLLLLIGRQQLVGTGPTPPSKKAAAAVVHQSQKEWFLSFYLLFWLFCSLAFSFPLVLSLSLLL
jgi:hypothetical protein